MSWSGLPVNLEDKIIPEPMSGCWLWLGGLRDKKDQYGCFGWEGKTWRSHRLVYTFLVAPVAAELDIDHLCRNHFCCNPDHLEPVTRKQNIARGVGVAPNNLRKTHCPQGHPYNEENTYVWAAQRFCRICSRKYKNAYSRRVRTK